MQNILAVDLGTKCGIAYNNGTAWACETVTLATPKELKVAALSRLNRRCDIRVKKLFIRLKELHDMHSFDIVIFEDVQFASSTYAVQLWASLRAALWLAFDIYPAIECVPVGTLKAFATGHGAATKPMMSAALKRKHPDQWSPKLDDNAVDAAWLWHWANVHLTRTLSSAKLPT